MKFLRFDSEFDARSAFADFMQEGEWPSYIDKIAVDVVGIVYQPTGVMLEDDIPEMEPTPGFHINLSDSIAQLQAFEIAPPSTPARVFAGIGEQAAPRVPSEVARWQAKLVLMRTQGQNGANLWEELMSMRTAIPDGENSVLLDAALLEVLNWRRTNPTVEWAAKQLGLSSAQVDELFIAAAALEL